MISIEEVEREISERGEDEVLKALKEERASLHPDKKGGKFTSKKEEERYHFLCDALMHINERNNSRQMIPISQLPAIIESISKSVAAQHYPSATVERNLKESFRSDLGRKYMAPKIGSGIFAGITGFLFTQSSALMEHPVLGVYFSSSLGVQLLGMGFLGSVGLLIISWMKERREEALSTYLLSEDALHGIYHTMEREAENGLVELHRVRRFYTRSNHTHFGPLNILLPPRLSRQVVDQIFEIQINRLVERKAIEAVEKPGIDRVFKLHA